MGTKVILKKLFSLSLARLGKVWSFWKVEEPTPTRPPKPGEKAMIVATIKGPRDHWPVGYVFQLPDARLVFGVMGEATAKLHTFVQLDNPDPDITRIPPGADRSDNIQPRAKLGLVPGQSKRITDPEVIRLIEDAYRGDAAPTSTPAPL